MQNQPQDCGQGDDQRRDARQNAHHGKHEEYDERAQKTLRTVIPQPV